jgi:DNA-binding Lrp family transcriptional regulator
VWVIDSIDQQIIRRVQGDFPLSLSPYKIIADEMGISEQELLSRLNRMKESGILRKMGAVLQHRLAGFHGNALCCWNVEPERLAEVSGLMADCSYISHVYLREPHPRWPYNLYTVFHSHTREQCLALVEQMAEQIGVSAYQMMFSRKNWKRAQLDLLQERQGDIVE